MITDQLASSGGSVAHWTSVFEVDPLGDTRVAVPVAAMSDSSRPNATHTDHAFEVIGDG